MNIDKRIEIIKYFEIYKSLLTEKQQNIFEDYYMEDLSINEISDELNITKNAVYNTIKKVENQLEEYENKLQINKKYNLNVQLLKNNNINENIIDKLL